MASTVLWLEEIRKLGARLVSRFPVRGAAVTDEHEPLGEQLAELYEAAVEAEHESGPPDETLAQAERHVVVRIARVGLGLVVLGAGLALIPLPGPGLLVVAAGLALMARGRALRPALARAGA